MKVREPRVYQWLAAAESTSRVRAAEIIARARKAGTFDPGVSSLRAEASLRVALRATHSVFIRESLPKVRLRFNPGTHFSNT